ncbi:protein-disulfide reductase DsbD family protein [Sphingorhabdus arenilitoris]|uniref:Protein-disulfide reductase DsbD family protein n=1 Tax=Sphingorhabdus arenilitoris TaxID=1490041 RepID=A0ABV8RDX1_9SPHN
MTRLFLFLLLLITPWMAVQAQLPGAPLNVPATLEAETMTPAPGGEVTLAFVMRPKPKWHGYWENGGDAGVGMNLQWDLPPGVTAQPLRYPVPKTLIIAGLMNYVYEKPYALLANLKIDPSVPMGTRIAVKVRANWLACDDRVCVPEGDDLSVNLTVGDGRISADRRSRFDGYRAALPVPLDQKGRYRIDGKMIEIAVPFPADADIGAPYFFPKTEKLFAYSAAQKARRNGDMVIIRTGVDSYNIASFGGGDVNGVLRYGEGRGVIVTLQNGAIPTGGTPILDDQAASGKAPENFLVILGLALLGGLLLNLMPCVFPILGLKALSLAKMGGDAASAKRDALAYSAGVILVCLALGAVMLALRAGGEQIGWAFQLQEPRVVLLLLLMMTAITVNLFGGFELGSIGAGSGLAGQSGVAGSFWTGILAALVATPCTGPFMAAALGAALLLPVPQALTLFAGLGLGLALPYLAIAYVPKARAMLPRPGPWLQKFRMWMGVPMALTAAALAWLLWRLSGQNGLFIGLSAAVLLTVILLFYGRMQYRRTGNGRGIMAAMAAGVMLCTGGAFVALPAEPVPAVQQGADNILAAEDYSAQRLAQYRQNGDLVFVYFTADWCVTCKVNEASSIDRAETARAFKKAGIKVLVGDFTRGDAEIARTLSQYNRPGVPLYLYFPRGGEAQILPQILTVDMLANLAEKKETETSL